MTRYEGHTVFVFGRLTWKLNGMGVHGEVTLNFEFADFCVHTVLNYEWGPPAARG